MRITAVLSILIAVVIFLAPCTNVLALESTDSTEPINIDELQADPGAVDVGEALIPPNSPLYFLKILREKIELALTFSQEGKVVRQLEFAQRRLREVNKLIKNKKQDLIGETMAKYRDHINQALAAASSDDLKVKVGEAISRHLDVLQRVYDGVGNETAKAAIRGNIERAAEHNRTLLAKLDTVKQKLLIKKTVLRQALACKFLGRESTASGISDNEKKTLRAKFADCQKNIKNQTPSWKIYTNETHGFSFKYPNDWVQSPPATGMLFQEPGSGPTHFKKAVGIQIYENAGNLSAKEFLDQIFYKEDEYTGNLKVLKDTYMKNVTYEKVSIDGGSATQFEPQIPTGSAGSMAWITNGSLGILLKSNNVEGGKQLLEQILTTFKFTQ